MDNVFLKSMWSRGGGGKLESKVSENWNLSKTEFRASTYWTPVLGY